MPALPGHRPRLWASYFRAVAQGTTILTWEIGEPESESQVPGSSRAPCRWIRTRLAFKLDDMKVIPHRSGPDAAGGVGGDAR